MQIPVTIGMMTTVALRFRSVAPATDGFDDLP